MLNIQSLNKNFLIILNKNPNSDNGLYLTPFKEGVIIGEIKDNNSYNIYFVDSDNSYQQDPTEQLEFESLCSPLMYLNTLDELFYKHLIAKDNYTSVIKFLKDKTYKDLDTELSTIHIDNIKITHRGVIKLFNEYFKDRIIINKKIGDLYTLSLTSESILKNICEVVCICLILFYDSKPENKPFIDDTYLTKYIHYFKHIGSEDYAFNSKFLRTLFVNETQYLKYEKLINPNDSFSIQFDRNSSIRMKEICNNIDLSKDILDIGCGWFAYYRMLTRKGFRGNYYCTDIDVSRKDKIKELNNQYGLNNIIWLDSLKDLKEFNGSIILSEVIEHMEYEKTLELLKEVNDIYFSELYITTPNKDFNINYGLEEGEYRHDDHCYELSFREFTLLIYGIFHNTCNCIYKQIGDMINGIASTSYVKITK